MHWKHYFILSLLFIFIVISLYQIYLSYKQSKILDKMINKKRKELEKLINKGARNEILK